MLRSGFTLIELLVVITIIAVLAGMLLPTVRLVRESARTTVCRTNLGQVMLGMLAYTDDWEGRLAPQYNPSGVRWFTLLAPYLAADTKMTATWDSSGLQKANSVIWGCPVWSKDAGVQSSSGDSWRCGYGQSLLLNRGETRTWQSNFANPGARDGTLAELSCHSARILLGDTMDWYLDGYWNGSVPKLDCMWVNPFPRTSTAAFCRADPWRHRGQANYAFVDGHVATLAWQAAAWGVVDPMRAP